MLVQKEKIIMRIIVFIIILSFASIFVYSSERYVVVVDSTKIFKSLNGNDYLNFINNNDTVLVKRMKRKRSQIVLLDSSLGWVNTGALVNLKDTLQLRCIEVNKVKKGWLNNPCAINKLNGAAFSNTYRMVNKKEQKKGSEKKEKIK